MSDEEGWNSSEPNTCDLPVLRLPDMFPADRTTNPSAQSSTGGSKASEPPTVHPQQSRLEHDLADPTIRSALKLQTWKGGQMVGIRVTVEDATGAGAPRLVRRFANLFERSNNKLASSTPLAVSR